MIIKAATMPCNFVSLRDFEMNRYFFDSVTESFFTGKIINCHLGALGGNTSWISPLLEASKHEYLCQLNL